MDPSKYGVTLDQINKGDILRNYVTGKLGMYIIDSCPKGRVIQIT